MEHIKTLAVGIAPATSTDLNCRSAEQSAIATRVGGSADSHATIPGSTSGNANLSDHTGSALCVANISTLTSTERVLVGRLLQDIGKPVSHAALMQALAEYGSKAQTAEIVRVLVCYARKKLARSGYEICTVQRKGYVMERNATSE